LRCKRKKERNMEVKPDMITPRWELKLVNYQRALSRLAEVVNVSKTRSLSALERDGMIQRFEFTHELAWKLMMSFCKFQSPEVDLFGSKDSTRWAFEHGLLEDGEVWMNMIASRNETSHNYDEELAADVYANIANLYYPAMLAFYNKMHALSSSPQTELFG